PQVRTTLRAAINPQTPPHHLQIRCSGPPAIPSMTFVADEGSFERSRVFAAACAAHGVYLHPHHNWFVSAALGEADVARVLEVTGEAFAEVLRGSAGCNAHPLRHARRR